MWPERLLQVAKTIRGMVDDAGMGELFQLVQMFATRTPDELLEYDSQFRRVLESLSKSIMSQLRVAENLSIPSSGSMKDDVEKVAKDLDSQSVRFMSSESSFRFTNPVKADLQGQLYNVLPEFDFVLISRLSDVGLFSSRISLAVEELDFDMSAKHVETLGLVVSDLERLMKFRTPVTLLSGGLKEHGALNGSELGDLDAGSQLALMREIRNGERLLYLKELALLDHAAVEEVRASESSTSLDEFYDGFSSVSLFLDVGFKDVLFCFAELLERGWIGGVKDRDGRQVLKIVQPDTGHLVSALREKMGVNEVTISDVMEKLRWDYFTAIHVIKELERGKELVPDDSPRAGLRWRWTGE
ncbi:MAG: hypothetical protein JSV27_03800 [Candidatus Bathyarchaeota archaeon]|nr:MAG: hypothetical protein JSV27_03800 [Candidatus Bathyarchaeota archaeon]